jgi:glucose/mannose-6-phosphate isomerase
MIDLNNVQKVLEGQGGDVVAISVDALPKQLEQSFTEASQIVFPDEYKSATKIVVSGMGGSRFPSLILQFLFKDKLKIPYLINDDYILPSFVDKKTLVILSSYSGTTEEVLAIGKLAKEKGAMLAGMCAGGDVAEFLKKEGAPCYVFDPIHNPSGQPRIGFGYAVGGHIGLLIALGVVAVSKEDVDSAIGNLPALLSNLKLQVPIDKNPVKQLAQKLHEKYPYYIVSEFLTGVGNAVGNQTNETAKSISSFRVIPELNHHMMEGLKHPSVLKDLGVFVFFYSKLYSTPIQKRYAITKDVVEQNKLMTVWYELSGKTKIEQVFELMGVGSYLSMYLAALYGEDPTVIPFVDYFKEQLKKL